MLQTLDAYLEKLNGLPQEKVNRLYEEAKSVIGDTCWIPNPGPQTAAYYSEADILLYGGQGGGGKTDLIAGLALTEHERSLLLRPQYTKRGALIERVVAVAGTRKGLNSAPPAQFKFDDRVIDSDGFVQKFDINIAHLPLEALGPTRTKHLIMGLVVPPVGLYPRAECSRANSLR